jgi:hypothetical protein
MLDVVVVTGPCGAGKTTVGFECLDLLEGAGASVAFLDGEFATFAPKPPGDPFGYAIAEAALRAVWPVYESAGHRRLLLSRVVEDGDQLGIVERALPGATVRLYRLVVSPETVRARLSRRETGSGLEWHVRRASEIARATLGEPVDAERPVTEVARDVLRRCGWLA